MLEISWGAILLMVGAVVGSIPFAWFTWEYMAGEKWHRDWNATHPSYEDGYQRHPNSSRITGTDIFGWAFWVSLVWSCFYVGYFAAVS